VRFVTQRALAIGVAAVAAIAVGGCGKRHEKLPAAPAGLRVQSSAFPAGGPMPRRFTCDGADVSPPVSWSAVPAGTADVVLVLRDPDAPGGSFQHWARWGIGGFAPAGLPAGVPADPDQEGTNDFGRPGYRGPCPPKGDKPHTYVFTVYAVQKRMKADRGANPDAVTAAIEAAHPLATGELRATYGR
jgi:Raf kinase inhibitor-like YbhB/YbcL family protein